ncbi:hypothetical protein H6G33_22550 [Calothrix sp. FACHB-1219]|uniref:hypothetical protein n=1 Tax=unclassified Calothrix TaxID=2619626 RepID=UPI00168923BA|nr:MULTISPECIES: hypothetical protein [unclassified Calothrix]MBD2204997.1 hypothetical protein [Calothrix sp. FACHB-168]MBD2219795.1 hypothetical protein [Calothrix sp. FACHB-1219]
MSKSQLIYSSHRKPCPICERTKDQDCRWNDDVVLCHTYIDKDAAISGYIYRGATDDGLWGQYFPIIEEPSNKKSYYPSASTKAEELSKPIRANSRKEFYYPDAQGDKLVKVVRTDSGDGQKKFAQYHWNGKEWEAKLTDEAKAKIHLYRIHEAINQDAIADGKPILKVEGEGKVDSLIKMGIPATCSIGGSGAWRRYGYPNYLEDLKGASVVLCPDQDVVGIKHCEEIAQPKLSRTQDIQSTNSSAINLIGCSNL